MMKRGKKKLMSDGTKGTLHERTQPKPSTGPEVGIFWFADGNLLIDHTPLSEAEPYGDFLIHPHGHDRVWERYKRNGIAPIDIEYAEAPRGEDPMSMTISKSKFVVRLTPGVLLADRNRLAEGHRMKQQDALACSSPSVVVEANDPQDNR